MPSTAPGDDTPWLALVVGNSRLHWAAFRGNQEIGMWHTPHFSKAQTQGLIEATFADSAWAALAADWGTNFSTDGLSQSNTASNLSLADLSPASPDSAVVNCGFSPPFPLDFPAPPPLWVASVVKDQGAIWATYTHCSVVTTDRVPLGSGYPTLGVDRALALVGAGEVYGWPLLVIDGGTALTLTAGADGNLVGGAILPGLRSQFRALHDYTDGLPWVDLNLNPATDSPWHDLTLANLPPRWATTTAEAMASGVLYCQLAGLRDFITDWRQQYGQGQVVFTGGDGPILAAALLAQTPGWAGFVQADPNLVFWGLRVCRRGGDYRVKANLAHPGPS